MIDTTVLNYQDEIIIDEAITLEQDNISHSEIKALSPLEVKAKLNYNEEDKIQLNLEARGIMSLEDAVSLKLVEFPFTINISETYESLDKTIDINEVLWQNILLEVPLKYTLEKDLKSFHGDGWKLVSQEEAEAKEGKTNIMADLIENMEKE